MKRTEIAIVWLILTVSSSFTGCRKDKFPGFTRIALRNQTGYYLDKMSVRELPDGHGLEFSMLIENADGTYHVGMAQTDCSDQMVMVESASYSRYGKFIATYPRSEVTVKEVEAAVCERFPNRSYSSEGNHVVDTPERETNSLPPASGGIQARKDPRGPIVSELCAELDERGLCYAFNWQPWVSEEQAKVAGAESTALREDSGTTAPPSLSVSWDSEPRIVFYGWRPHDSESASVYTIVAPTSHQVDVIWQRGNEITYLGPNSDLLRANHVYEYFRKCEK